MKKFLIVISLLILTMAFGWSGHSTLTNLIVRELGSKVNELVEITPYSYSAIDNRPYNSENLLFEDYLGKTFIPEEDILLYKKIFDNPVPVDNKAPIWQILSVYSYEPDMGMDKNFEITGLESILGDSQGTRHMEYRLGPMKIGNVTSQPSYFAELAKTAWKSGDTYWAFRFIARGMHYMEDTSQPFHTFPAPLYVLPNLALDFDRWMSILINYHFAYDYYGGYLLWKNYPPLMEAIENAEPKYMEDPEKAARSLRRFSRSKLNSVYSELKKLIKSDLETSDIFAPNTEYFDSLVESGETKKLDKLTVEILGETASYVKGYIQYMQRELNW